MLSFDDCKRSSYRKSDCQLPTVLPDRESAGCLHSAICKHVTKWHVTVFHYYTPTYIRICDMHMMYYVLSVIQISKCSCTCETGDRRTFSRVGQRWCQSHKVGQNRKSLLYGSKSQIFQFVWLKQENLPSQRGGGKVTLFDTACRRPWCENWLLSC